ncbi:MAG: DUF2079 domain-containing protein [Acidimicrobiales bacterium]
MRIVHVLWDAVPWIRDRVDEIPEDTESSRRAGRPASRGPCWADPGAPRAVTRLERAEALAGTDRQKSTVDIALKVAWCALGCQLVAMLFLSWAIYHRWSNTWDYAIRFQGWWGIAHGNLDPYSSVVGRFFLHDHFELINWPLAPLSLVWPHGLWPLWIQDLMVSSAEVGAVLIVADALRRREWSLRIPGWVAVATVTLMLVANPWIYESIAFDFHYQSVGAACFALLACRELMGGSTYRLVVWSALCLACGDIAATYLAAVGIGGILAGAQHRRRGGALVVAGAVWFALVLLIGANQGSNLLGHYGYLAGAGPGVSVGILALLRGVLGHPGRGLGHLWSEHVDLWAYGASSGVIGLCTPWAVLPVVVLLENGLSKGSGVTGTAYESFGAVIFLIPLSVLALGRIDRWLVDYHRTTDRPKAARRWRLLVPALCIAMAAYALAWGALWDPHVPGRWVKVTSTTASVLDHVERLIPNRAEVVASQGVIGRFADRQWLYRSSKATTVALHTPFSYFVIVPEQGIELASAQESEALIAELAGPLHAHLLVHRAGVWAFRLHRTRALHSVVLAEHVTSLPAWIGHSDTGTLVLAGPVASWHVAQSVGRRGDLLSGIIWDEVPGNYELTTTVDNRSAVELEVWDASTKTVLTRQHLGAVSYLRTVRTRVRVRNEVQTQAFTGFGPFTFLPTRPQLGDHIEVRILSPGTRPVDLYSLGLQRRAG